MARPSEQKHREGHGFAEVPGTYATLPGDKPLGTTPNASNLPQGDRELLAITNELSTVIDSARNLVLFGGRPDGLRSENLEAAKREARIRLQGALLKTYGLREEDGPPYRDARMLLTDWLVRWGREVRRQRDGKGVAAYSESAEQALVESGALETLRCVAAAYPTLTGALSKKATRSAAEAAIADIAKTPHRLPWKRIVNVWRGVDAGITEESWRVDWNKHRQRIA